MTPALQQALKLLQVSSLELDVIIREALESNPLLALEEAPEEHTPPSLIPVKRKPSAGYRPTPVAIGLCGAAAKQGAECGSREVPATSGAAQGEVADLTSRSLRDVLFEDMVFAFPDTDERSIAIDLAGLLDEAGYLAGDLRDVAEQRRVPLPVVTTILERLQSMAPAGVFARDLAECLRLQLLDGGTLDPRMSALLDHLELLTKGGPAQLAAAAGLDIDEMPALIERLRGLDPRPGATLAGATAPAIVPDLIIRPVSDTPMPTDEFTQRVGQWMISLNPDLIPTLSLDRETLQRLRAQSRKTIEKDYLKDQAQDATWLIRAVEQRTATILKVGVTIFERQLGFLDHGIAGLRPMTQRNIAAAADVHESTISRAANNKYAATPQGVIALKFLFSAEIPNTHGGPGHAAKVVRHRLRELVAAEETALSDDALTRLLRAEGYDVARRTIAKYRDLLRIPSSIQRRRLRLSRPAGQAAQGHQTHG